MSRSRERSQAETIAKLAEEEARLAHYIQEFTQAIEKKKTQEVSPAEDLKQKQLLEKELANAKVMLRNYEHELRTLQKQQLSKQYTAEHVAMLDASIVQKEQELRELREELKNYSIIKRRQLKIIDRQEKEEDGSRLARLVEELRKQKEVLEGLNARQVQAEQALHKRKLKLEEVQAAYLEKCRLQKQTPITFEEFKDKKTRKTQASKTLEPERPKSPKKIITVKDIISGPSKESSEAVGKSAEELQEKKKILLASINALKKKHLREIVELENELSTVSAEGKILAEKLAERKREKQEIEEKVREAQAREAQLEESQARESQMREYATENQWAGKKDRPPVAEEIDGEYEAVEAR